MMIYCMAIAIGGKDDTLKTTNHIYRYDCHTNSWNVISRMKNNRSSCLAFTLPEDHLIVVVGGYAKGTSVGTFPGSNETNSVEILE